MKNEFRVITVKENTDLINDMNNLHSIGWPKFMREDPIALRYWDKLFSLFPEFQFLLLDGMKSSNKE